MLIWRSDVKQREINVETTLCTSTLKCTTLNKVESTLSLSTLILTILDKAETTLSFSTSSFTVQTNIVETTLRILPHVKSLKINLELRAIKYFWVSNKMHLKWNALNSVETTFSKSCSIYFHCLPQITAVSYFSNCSSLVHFKRNTEKNISQPTPDVATTLGFGCFLVATLGNVEATLLHSCVFQVVVTLTIIRVCYNVLFSTSIFRPHTYVVATSCFRLRFSDENLTVYQRHYEFSPKVIQIVF